MAEIAGKQVRRITIKGNVPAESWPDIFRAFIGPFVGSAARINLKRLRLGIEFEMEVHDDQPLDENDPTLKAIKEAAQQLGLGLEEEQ